MSKTNVLFPYLRFFENYTKDGDFAPSGEPVVVPTGTVDTGSTETGGAESIETVGGGNDDNNIIVSAEEQRVQAEALADSIYNSRMSSIDASQGALDRKNYLAYRRLIDMYLPEYLNSSGLYDAGSMSQAFLDAKNGYINKSEDIARTYDAQRSEAANVLAQSKADALGVYQGKIDKMYEDNFKTLTGFLNDIAASGNTAALDSFKDDYADMYNGLNDYYKSLIDMSLASTKEAALYSEISASAEKLSTYLEYAAETGNYEFINNFETKYKDEIESLPEDFKGDLMGYLGVLKQEQEYLDYLKGEEEKAKAEELQSKVINLADKGYTVVGGDDINTGQKKNFNVSLLDGGEIVVEIRNRTDNQEIAVAASNVANGQLFAYMGNIFVKLSDGIFEVGGRSGDPRTINPLRRAAGYGDTDESTFFLDRYNEIKEDGLLSAYQNLVYQVLSGNFYRPDIFGR